MGANDEKFVLMKKKYEEQLKTMEEEMGEKIIFKNENLFSNYLKLKIGKKVYEIWSALSDKK